ncbi:hypothetical protein DPEC_G00030100 [Dallia pectoralis]|uniref:Uncharacterized protein n=1 Tax=Dallia pectoralis TaxID=75939 RepID=A0ACC2HBU3_DALPE|nr:hypothetical protein DPEC_G00030100 [Dallia pectoralis]
MDLLFLSAQMIDALLTHLLNIKGSSPLHSSGMPASLVGQGRGSILGFYPGREPLVSAALDEILLCQALHYCSVPRGESTATTATGVAKPQPPATNAWVRIR